MWSLTSEHSQLITNSSIYTCWKMWYCGELEAQGRQPEAIADQIRSMWSVGFAGKSFTKVPSHIVLGFGIKRLFTKGKERLFTAIRNRGSNSKIYEGYYLSHINPPGLFGSSHSNRFHLLLLQAMFQIKVCMITLKGCILLIKRFCSRPCVCLSLQGIQH